MAASGRTIEGLGSVTMRIGTWNTLSGSAVSANATDTLAASVARLDLDVLGLNEVDYRLERSGFADQARDAALAMGAVDWRFGPSFRGEDRARISVPGTLFGPADEPRGSHYGIALLSRIPVRRWHRLELGQTGGHSANRQRPRRADPHPPPRGPPWARRPTATTCG